MPKSINLDTALNRRLAAAVPRRLELRGDEELEIFSALKDLQALADLNQAHRPFLRKSTSLALSLLVTLLDIELYDRPLDDDVPF